jgi:hypothetical protein
MPVPLTAIPTAKSAVDGTVITGEPVVVLA